MVSLNFVFWMYVVLFAVIGGMRGWAKEILVTFSVILALAFTALLDHYVPFVRDVLQKDSSPLYFWLRSLILILLVFFGYQTPNVARFAAKMTREKLEHIILGVVIGAINGYLIAGTIWFYMADAKYPFPNLVQPPTGDLATAATNMLHYMPPKLLGIPGIYFAVVLAFIFVIVVFV
ncbi:MAG TPA: CvpA family protein [Anaerolineales bacterium]|nr:CvpA family protein [Anaerolineales bacterium]